MVQKASPQGISKAIRVTGGGSGKSVQGRSSGTVANTGSGTYQGFKPLKQGMSQGGKNVGKYSRGKR
jgi:hypothetical protein